MRRDPTISLERSYDTTDNAGVTVLCGGYVRWAGASVGDGSMPTAVPGPRLRRLSRSQRDDRESSFVYSIRNA